MKTICPSCGSEQVETRTNRHWLPIVYGAPAEWEEKIDHCLLCGESGDFSGGNDSYIEDAIKAAKKQSVVSMLDSLSESGVKMAYLERALELSPRTSARWKNGECSASSLALIRIINTLPWLLEVADAGFDRKVAMQKMFLEVSKGLFAMPVATPKPRIDIKNCS